VNPEVLRKLPKPKLADLLGWKFESFDAEKGELTLSFVGREDFTNPTGNVQGGMLAAMMDDTMGPAMVIVSNGEKFAPTIDLHTHFLRPVKPGPITVKARVTQMGRTIAFGESELFDSRGRLCARATCSSAVMPLQNNTPETLEASA